jgi:uncharacterized membrane protein
VGTPPQSAQLVHQTLFILPFCYFAYKKSVRGMVLTVVAVTSSMFGFPAPATPDPTAVTFLAVERQWVTGPRTLGQVVLTALVPVWFIALAAALRRRLWVAAALVIVSGTALKVAWSVYVGGPVRGSSCRRRWVMRWLRAS